MSVTTTPESREPTSRPPAGHGIEPATDGASSARSSGWRWSSCCSPSPPSHPARRSLSLDNFRGVAAQTVIVGLGALGMTLIIISGGIDLSVGSVLALTSVVVALLLNKHVPPALAVLAAVALGGSVAGAINGTLITGLRVTPFIVTLGTLGIARGVASLAGERAGGQRARDGWINEPGRDPAGRRRGSRSRPASGSLIALGFVTAIVLRATDLWAGTSSPSGQQRDHVPPVRPARGRPEGEHLRAWPACSSGWPGPYNSGV